MRPEREWEVTNKKCRSVKVEFQVSSLESLDVDGLRHWLRAGAKLRDSF